MRILVISNLFPPHVLGGCEILCAQACAALRAAGHEIAVLTSDHGRTGGERDAFPVQRRLRLVRPFAEAGRLDRLRRLRVGREAYRITRDVIAAAQPEVVFVWNLLRLTVGPARAAQDSGLPVAYSFNDENVASYAPVPFALSPRRVAGWLADRVVLPRLTVRGLDFAHSTCISAQLKQRLLGRGLAVEAARVIYQGIPVGSFPEKAPRPASRPARVLYAGQLVESKGIPTLIEAAHRIAREAPQAIELFLAGAGPAEVEERLRALAAAGPARVHFLGRVPHAAMPALHRDHDFFVFPSIGPEAFGLTHLEAMASGTPVVSTATGGQGEFLRDGENALVFAPGDAAGLAAALLRLLDDPARAAALARTARAQVEREFSLDRYVAQLGGLLEEARGRR